MYTYKAKQKINKNWIKVDFKDLRTETFPPKQKKQLYRLWIGIKRHTWIKILATDTDYMDKTPGKLQWKKHWEIVKLGGSLKKTSASA